MSPSPHGSPGVVSEPSSAPERYTRRGETRRKSHSMAEKTRPTPPSEEDRAIDHDLLRRSQEGDQEAFGDLVRRHERV